MAREMIVSAQQVAVANGSTRIGTEHLLLVLVEHPNTVASLSLKSLNVDIEELRSTIALACQGGSDQAASVFSASCKRAIELAFESARKFGHSHIGTGHLLIGLLRSTDGSASRLLNDFSVNDTLLLEEVVRLDELESPGKIGMRERISSKVNKILDFIKDF